MSAARRTAIRTALLRWYDAERQAHPWRRDRDSYRVWIAEVMLQQTRIEVVTPAYERFLDRLPSLASLAAASEDDVLSLWSGLGYYSRARALHAAAQQIVTAGQAQFPADLDAALALPGVGAYTAAAVLSIAHGQPLAAVDGNVVRVLARLDRLALPNGRGEPHRTLAEELLDPQRPGDWNQAVMELGQRICTPRAPRCDACPLARHCAALRDGAIEQHPPARARRSSERIAAMMLLLRDRGGRVLLERGAFVHLPHLWLPPIGLQRAPQRRAARAAAPELPPALLAGLGGAAVEHLGSFKHAILHRSFEVALHAAVLSPHALERVAAAAAPAEAPPGSPAATQRRLFRRDELARIGRSSLLSKALRLLDALSSSEKTKGAA